MLSYLEVYLRVRTSNCKSYTFFLSSTMPWGSKTVALKSGCASKSPRTGAGIGTQTRSFIDVLSIAALALKTEKLSSCKRNHIVHKA